jgi:hypothetical protein
MVAQSDLKAVKAEESDEEFDGATGEELFDGLEGSEFFAD